MAGVSDDTLRERAAEMRVHFRRHPDATDHRLAEALAIVREAAARTLGMRPFTVQIMGALALRRGFLAEMATGEGKSLTAALAAVLAAWSGRPCHVITVNDYLLHGGTDILLGDGVVALGGLHVIATERHESRRIDRQLFGRAGRQGDSGSAQAFLSMEDELFRRFVPAVLRSPALAGVACRIAQRTAQRLAFRARRSVLERDTWLDESLAFAGRE